MVDAYSKWMEAFVLQNITADSTINILRSVFARFGFPKLLVSDNGTQFMSEKFQKFLSLNGIKFKSCPPYHPATNGAAENAVKTIKRALINAIGKGPVKDLNLTLNRFLFDFRNTPHCTTNISPTKLMLGRNVRTRFDLLLPESKTEHENKNEIQTVIRNKQNTQIKNYKGKRNRKFEINEIVAVRDYRYSKPCWTKAKIIKILGPRTYLTYVPEIQKQWRRHVNQILDYTDFSVTTTVVNKADCNRGSSEITTEEPILPYDDQEVMRTRSNRVVYKPDRYGINHLLIVRGE